MADEKQSGGVNVQAEGDANVGGNVVGRDNIESTTTEVNITNTRVESGPTAIYAIAGIALVAVIAILAFALTRPPTRQAPAELLATATTPATLPTVTLTPVPLPTTTPTPVPPPAFITEGVFDLNASGGLKQVEFDFEPGMLPTETITNFLKLSRIALGRLGGPADKAFNVRYVISNTGPQPLMLDLDQRFFSLEDDQGRAAELVYFCCAAKGDILPAGQAREVQLFFKMLPGWMGKETSAHTIFFRVRGLLPVVRATWQMQTLATAD